MLVLRSAVGKTHVLRSRLVMDYTTSYFPLIAYCITDGMLHVAFWNIYSIFNNFSSMKEQPNH